MLLDQLSKYARTGKGQQVCCQAAKTETETMDKKFSLNINYK